MKPIEEFTKKAAEVLKSLEHPVRIEILRLLNDKRRVEISVKHIHETLGLTHQKPQWRL